MKIYTWLSENVEWLFGGIGLSLLAALAKWFWTRFKGEERPVVLQRALSETRPQQPFMPTILFVDDKSFSILTTLQRSGWPNIRRIADVKSLKGIDVKSADILFIDIQGVGKALKFHDEGLGLALAIKTEYPQKKVVIYSSNTHGNMFHPALNQVDATLPKNASTYQFEQLIEQFTKELAVQ